MAQFIISPKYRFISFSHPYSNLFTKQINKYGIDGVLNPSLVDLQKQSIKNDFFEEDYNPTNTISTPYPKDEIDFSYSGAYSVYNWEIFFHAPMLIAENFSKNQKFEEAQKWYHYIFDPTISEGDSPKRYWKLKPFVEYNDSLTTMDLMNEINSNSSDARFQIKEWEQNPFNPHLIARLRIISYMKNVLMKYIDNLISWGDYLFRKDSIEYINEASQIYILAAQILGRRPVKIKQANPEEKTFADIKDKLDEFSNIMVKIEDNHFINDNTDTCDNQINIALQGMSNDDYEEITSTNDLGSITSILYYCTPQNKKLLSYWDTVADRLFKIRHCMNIEGVERHLALFEAPIDPALLIKATASGISIGDALNDISASLPHYRFRFIFQKAIDLVNDVKALGQSLLSALEKKDAEQLSLIRAEHEISLSNAITSIKENNILEADENIKALELSKKNIRYRKDYYSNKKYMNNQEKMHLLNLKTAQIYEENAQSYSLLASFLTLIPQFHASISPKIEFGGKEIASAISFIGQIQSMIAAKYNHTANVASIKGGYDRRKEDWTFQVNSAEKEITQIEKQIDASKIRLAIAKKDLDNHKLQIENSNEAKEFMENKYTNKELYNWMTGEISSLYFRTYKLAYEMAKKAERNLQFELGKTNTNYIQYGHWDSLKKGLLSGEKLSFQLKQMEVSYIEQNKREYEITKQVSLMLLNPNALIDLRVNGKCEFEIPEILFDMDFPGQYFRRIKSISLTLPAVTGPYTGINCKLTLINNRIRKENTLKENNNTSVYKYMGIEDERFAFDYIAKSVATSSGRNDAGMFEVNFNDERYLPFEGKGVIGRWQLELPNEFRQFDYNSITDVILTINYTSREGGIKNKVVEEMTSMVTEITNNNPNMSRYISLKSEFSQNFNELILNTQADGDETDFDGTTIKITKKLIPYFFNNKTVTVQNVKVFAIVSNPDDFSDCEIAINSTFGQFDRVNGNNKFFETNISVNKEITDDDTNNDWTLLLKNLGDLTPDEFEDIIIILEYKVED